MQQDTLIIPRYLVPVRPRGTVLEGHGVLLRADRIEAIVPPSALAEVADQATVVNLPSHALLPGLVNTHTHSPMTLLRGFADDLPLLEWLNGHIWPAENRLVDEDFVAAGTRLAICEMLRGGTTCFNENYFFPDEIARVAVESKVRSVVGLPLLDQATSWANEFDEYLQKGLELVDSFEDGGLVEFSLAPHAPYSVSDAGLESIAEVSAAREMKVHLHCLETAYDLEHSLETYGLPPLNRLSSHDLLNDRLIAVHMTQLDQDDVAMLADCGVHVVHCPHSNLKLASGFCPTAALLESGVNVAIGTDGAASNNKLDMFEETRCAALLAKGVTGDATAVDAVAALDMMTINGARALGMDEAIGSIERGKKADLCAIDLDQAQTTPLHNLFSQLIYAASASQVSDTWVDGNRVLDSGRLTSLDETAVKEEALAWRVRIGESASQDQAAAQ